MDKTDLCGAGSELLSIGASGNVYPCAAVHDSRFIAGNIRVQGIEKIWKDSTALKEFSKFSVSHILECNACEFKFVWGGNFRADRYIHIGHMDDLICLLQDMKQLNFFFWELLLEEACSR